MPRTAASSGQATAEYHSRRERYLNTPGEPSAPRPALIGLPATNAPECPDPDVSVSLCFAALQALSMAIGRGRSLPRSLPEAPRAVGAALSWPDEPSRAGPPRSHLPCPLAADHHLLPGDPPGRGTGQPVRHAAGAAERLRRPGSRRPPWRPAAAVRLPPRTSLLLSVISNPLWIALTAPGRWVGDRLRRHPPSWRTGERTLTAPLPASCCCTGSPPSRPPPDPGCRFRYAWPKTTRSPGLVL